MDELRLLIDLHRRNPRQGPGGGEETVRAMDLARIPRDQPLRIADIGCGTGASTLVLAECLKARITAVDLLPDFLEDLQARATAAGLADRVETLCCSMEALPFDDEEFDLLWSEGAIYIIGFQQGIRSWHRFLKPGGLLVVSEITWTTASRPAELQQHWDQEYPEIAVASSKLRVLEQAGYSPIGYFTLPQSCWIENYYGPLQDRFDAFLQRNGNCEEARRIVEAENREIELYRKFRNFYSYGVYIARKI